MQRKLRAAQYGCGKMSVYSMRYVYEKGAEIVAAFDVNPAVINKDIGDIAKIGKKGVLVQDAKNAAQILKEVKPDICIITTQSLFKDVFDAFKTCAQAGVNAISTCEEAFFPANSSPALTAELDKLAKEHGCTLCGSGYQDVFWGNLITVLSGATLICYIVDVVDYRLGDMRDVGRAYRIGNPFSVQKIRRVAETADI